MASSPLLSRWLARASDPRAAVHDARGEASWRELVTTAERAAAALLGDRRSLDGERVALMVSPGAAFVSTFFGVLRAGGVAVVLSPLHAPRETRFFCDDAGVRTVVASPELAHHVEHLAPERRLVPTGDLAAAPAAPVRAEPREADPALQLYTSGTTGKPKGAVLTHANLSVQQQLLVDAWGLTERDTLLHLLPLHHMHGLAIALLSALGAGAAARFVASAPFDAPAVWNALERGTVLMAVPTIHAKLFSAFDAADAPTRRRWQDAARGLRLVTSGSAALPVTTGERWRALSGAYPLERFGMTEIGVGASNPLRPDRRRPGTVGLPLPTVEARIVDDDGRDAATGELWIAGPSVFDRYHGRDDATRDAFVPDGARRWFKTGDTVTRDAEGYLRVLGRTSVDILKSGGYKLSALEIEEVLRENAAVAEVAVVGLPDETWGDRVVACVVPRAGRESDCGEEALRAFAAERLARYKVPRRVIVVRDLPRNALGKVMKQELVASLSDS